MEEENEDDAESQDVAVEEDDESTEVLDLYVNKLKLVEYKEESDVDDDTGDLLTKNTASFRCLNQILMSRSSLLRHPFYHFPPLKDPGIEEAFNHIEPTPEIDTVGSDTYLKKCKILGIMPLSRILKSLHYEVIDLMYFGLNEYQMHALMDALKVNNSVTELILQDNWLTPAGVKYLSEMLYENNNIVYLNLQECRLQPEGALFLSEGLTNSSSIRELDLSFNSLGNFGLKNLEEGLIDNNSIVKLNLSNNNFGEDSATYLANIIHYSDTLVDLDLSWNRFFTMKGNKILFAALAESKTIKNLNISWNGIGTVEAAGPIMKYLKDTTVLEHLNISNNRLTDAPLRSVRLGIMKCDSLVSVRIGNNPINAEEAKALANVYNSARSLKYIDMENVFVQKDFIKIWDKFTKMGKNIRIGGVLSNYPIYGPDTVQVLFRRARFLAMKAKSKKAQKDFGHFVLKLPEDNITKQEFMVLADNFKAKKVDNELLDGIANAFPFKKDRVDCIALRNSYMRYYPETELPPPKPKKEKKGKPEKAEKGKPTGADGAQSIMGDEGEEEEEGASEQTAVLANEVVSTEEQPAPAGDQPAPAAES